MTEEETPVWGDDEAGEPDAGATGQLKLVKAEPVDTAARSGRMDDDDSDAPTPPRRCSPPRFSPPPAPPPPVRASDVGADTPMRPRDDDGISLSPSPSPRRGAPSPPRRNGDQRPDGEHHTPFVPQSRMVGRVMNFQEEKGFGFLQGEGSDEQFFVHFSGIVGKGFKKLEKGQQVLFDTEWNEKKEKPQAANVRLLQPGTETGHRKMSDSFGKRQRSRSPRGRENGKPGDEDPLFDAVSDTLTWLFRDNLETDATLHKKVGSYLRQAAKRTSFEGHMLDIFQVFADHFFGSIFAAYGDRPWLMEMRVDFALVFDTAAQELFPEGLVARFAQEKGKLSCLLHKAHDMKYDSQRFFHFLHDCVKSCGVEGKKTQHKVSEACTVGRDSAILKVKQSIGIDVWNSREEDSFDVADLEAFTKCWIEATLKEVRARGTKEGCGLDGILTKSCAVELFNSLLRDRAFPQIMTRSLKHQWPDSPWDFVRTIVLQVYGGGAFALEQRPLRALMDNSGDLAGDSRYNAQVQRQQGYGRRHRQPLGPHGQLPLAASAGQHRSVSSLQHFGTEDRWGKQGNATHSPTFDSSMNYGGPGTPAPPAALDYQSRLGSYGSRAGAGFGARQVAMKQELEDRGAAPLTSAPPSRLGSYGSRAGYGTQRAAVKQENDSHERRPPPRVLARAHPEDDSEDDYNGHSWREAAVKNGKGGKSTSRHGYAGKFAEAKVKEEVRDDLYGRARW